MVKDKLVYSSSCFGYLKCATYIMDGRPIKQEIACPIFQVNSIDGYSIINVVEYTL